MWQKYIVGLVVNGRIVALLENAEKVINQSFVFVSTKF